MKLKHVSIAARSVDRLAAFYCEAFGCSVLRPRRTVTGERVWRGNGLADVSVESIWLSLGAEAPFLELLQYDLWQDRAVPAVNEPGYGHMAFAVDDIEATYARIIASGGAALGEITNFGTPEVPYWIVYMRDPEGNILEIEQG